MKRENLEKAINIDNTIKTIESQLELIEDELVNVQSIGRGGIIKLRIEDSGKIVDLNDLFTKENLEKLVLDRREELLSNKLILEKELEKL